MIRLYQGVDIVEISKFKGILLRHDAFLRDIFTDQERAYCESRKRPYIHFAGRFAAKESCLKALGTGFSGPGIDHTFKEIEVIPDASGKPRLSLSGWAEKISKRRKIDQWTVSISHSADYAVATVILLGN
ncbi:MAG TPA: holo-ACP synthase [Thermodesulfovibrionales bacterium]|nr:holo-ACP synthase [Thermodesulfovibrionales bacterium]